MSIEIRLEKNRFRPAQSLAAEVSMLEQRTLLCSSFKLPANLVGMIAGQSGNLVLTSRAYGQAQAQIDKAFKNFAGTMAKLQNQLDNNKITPAQFNTLVGIGGAGIYAPNSALGRLDSALRTAEAKFPYGRGVSIDPVTAGPLGVGLSVASAAISPNASLAVISADPVYAGASGSSVAELLDAGLQNAFVKPSVLINSLRNQTLQFKPLPAGFGQLGTVPQYLAQFGPLGTGSFSVKNT